MDSTSPSRSHSVKANGDSLSSSVKNRNGQGGLSYVDWEEADWARTVLTRVAPFTQILSVA
jgi:hypothetical protein